MKIIEYIPTRSYPVGVELARLVGVFSEYINTVTQPGLYYRGEILPFILLGSELMLPSNESYYINSLSDLQNFCKQGGRFTIELISNDTTKIKQVIFNRDNIDLHMKHISNSIDKFGILNIFLEYKESSIMYYSHSESDICITDIFGISNDIPIVSDIAYKFNDIILYLKDIFNLNVIDDMICDISEDIIGELNSYIYNGHIVLFTNSIKLELRSNTIIFKEGPSPSALRYRLNSEIKIFTDELEEQKKIYEDISHGLPDTGRTT